MSLELIMENIIKHIAKKRIIKNLAKRLLGSKLTNRIKRMILYTVPKEQINIKNVRIKYDNEVANIYEIINRCQ